MNTRVGPNGELPNGITRDVLENDDLRASLIAQDPDIETLSDAEMRASIREMRVTAPDDAPRQGVWLFAYGSLLWNPCAPVGERRDTRIYGFHRDFRIKLVHGRGSPEAPTLMLGLVPGGSCRGMALWLTADDLEHELLMVWRREMLTGVYRPRWVRAWDGEHWLPAITFVVNPRHANYCERLAEAEVVDMLATGSGQIGTAAAYLDNTVGHLEAEGILDRRLRALKTRVDAVRQPSR